MAWLRLYDEVADDPKVQKLPLLLFRAWINCLCIAKRYDGVLPEMIDVAYTLRVTESRAQTIVDQLIEAELFEKKDGSIVPHNWRGRQFQSDTSAARMKRHRERHCDVTVTVPVTDQNRDRTEQTPKPPPSVAEYSPEFEAFWTAYPKRKSKGDAWKAWKRIKPSAALQEIILKNLEAAVKSADWLKDHGQFIPYPATWLNDRGWDDDYGQAKAAAGGFRPIV